ncbi:MAG: SUMF1/EgtB/PvdO family nonheme iron enzyme, partial [Candidatus Brocadiia bacterium]
FTQVASALAEGHECGILHRDIKPSNVLLDRKGRVKVADFGLAKRPDTDVSITVTGQSLGTPLYMPPEVAKGQAADARSDLYSLGATFYHLLAGRPPFGGTTAAELAVQHTQARVPPLKDLAPDAPPALCRLVHRLLRKSPADRYASAGKLLEALARVEARAAQPAAPTHAEATRTLPAAGHLSRAERLEAKKRQRRRAALIGGVTGGVALVLLVVLLTVLGGGDDQQAKAPPDTEPQAEKPDREEKPKEKDEPETPKADPHERHAEALFEGAQRAVESEDWAAAADCLDRLDDEFADTDLYADHRYALVALRRKVENATAGDTPPPEPAGEWTTLPNGWRVGQPVNLGPQINSGAIDRDVFVAADGRTLLFQSTRPGGQGNSDFYRCTRLDARSEWGEPVSLGPPVNTPHAECSVWLSYDGLSLWFSSDRPGGLGGADLWRAIRPDKDAPWGEPQHLGPTLNSPRDDYSVRLTEDLCTLVLHSPREGGHGRCDLWMATRPAADASWGEPENLGPTINTQAFETNPWISPDGTVLLFQSDRAGGGRWDIFMSTRPGTAEPFGEPVALGSRINAHGHDGGPGLSADLRTLYFHSDRPGGSGELDLWRAPIRPPATPALEQARWGPWEDLFDGKSREGWRPATGGPFSNPKKAGPEDGVLVLESQPGNHFAGAVATRPIPRSRYEVAYEARRVRGEGDFASLTFPVGEESCCLIVGGFQDGSVVGLDQVDGRRADDNPTTHRMDFATGRWYDVRLRVTDQGISAWVDGGRVIHQPRAGHAFGLFPMGEAMRPFGLHAWSGRAEVRNIRLRRLKPYIESEDGPWKIYLGWPFDAAEARRRQAETAKALGVPVEQDIDLDDGGKMTMVLIPAGEFLMGSPPTTSPEQLKKVHGGKLEWWQREFPQHRVRISRPFWLGKTEVTQAQWQALMGENPSTFKPRPDNPVEQLNWNDCQGFVQKLSAKLKKPFRLPTEAEWEYACRAGAATQFYFGDSQAALPQYAWVGSNSGGSTHLVGQRKPNAWGLHDMHGNVWEWCEDGFAPYEKGAQVDPKGPGAGRRRVFRGGSWRSGPAACRSANRNVDSPTNRDNDRGCRVCVVAKPTASAARPDPAAQTPRQPAARATEADQALARLLAPVEGKVRAWHFAAAAAQLAKVKVEDPALAERLARRRDELQRLVALKAKMIQRINTAKPRLTKRSLGIPGIGADLVEADDQAITARRPDGETETFPWEKLDADAVRRLARYTAKSPEDHLAAGILLLDLGEPQGAEKHLAQAKAEGLAIAPYLDPLAAAAFARAQGLLEEGRGAQTPRLQEEKFRAAAAALGELDKK